MTSAMVFEPEFVQSLQNIPWFSSCGQSLSPDLLASLPWELVPVTTLKKAMRQWSSSQWESATLEARNELTGFLATQARDAYQQWNAITLQAKLEVAQPLAEKFWQPYAQQQGLDADFLHSVQWDILALCMEHAYRQQRDLPQFFHALLKVYEVGHLPCGWEGGKYPKGKLLVW